MRMLQPAIAKLDQFWGACAQVDQNRPPAAGGVITARQVDEAQPAGVRVYIGAHGQMAVTRDNLTALWALVSHHGVLPWSTWSLLRPAFETAFNTVWMLEPETSLERRRRALRMEVINFREANAVLEEHTRNPVVRAEARRQLAERKRTTEQVFRGEAKLLGMEWDQAKAPVNKVDELKKLRWTLSFDEAIQSVIPATWRILSGAEHGHSHALLTNSDVTRESTIPGGQHIQVVVNDESLQTQAGLVLLMAIEGARLYHRRCVRSG